MPILGERINWVFWGRLIFGQLETDAQGTCDAKCRGEKSRQGDKGNHAQLTKCRERIPLRCKCHQVASAWAV